MLTDCLEFKPLTSGNEVTSNSQLPARFFSVFLFTVNIENMRKINIELAHTSCFFCKAASRINQFYWIFWGKCTTGNTDFIGARYICLLVKPVFPWQCKKKWDLFQFWRRFRWLIPQSFLLQVCQHLVKLKINFSGCGVLHCISLFLGVKNTNLIK